MTRPNGDANGKGEAARSLLHKPSITIPVAVVVATLIAVFGYGQSTGDTEAKVNANATSIIATNDRIDRGDKRLEKAFEDMNDRLDVLIGYLLPSRWDQ